MQGKKAKKTGPRSPNQMMLRRTLILMIVCGIVAFTVLIGRLFQLQILDHDYYESSAVEQQVRETTITASRGTIYDTNMKILAMSASVDTIYISPAEIKLNDEDAELIARGLSDILGVSYESILEKAQDTSSWYKTISRKVEQEVSDQVREFKNTYNLTGVKIEVDTKRYYPYSSLASHIIGFVGSENTGLSGIELSYNSTLTGVNGRVVRAKNAYGTDMLFTNFEDYYDAQDGSGIVLTVDSTIQYYVEKHLEQAVSDYDIQNGAAAIAMDVNTGAILAMASLGDFDLNNYQIVSDEIQAEIDEQEDEEVKQQLLTAAQTLQWRNKAINDTYEPGSTFKIITLAMALEEGVVSTSESFYCGGHVSVVGRTTPVNCWRTAGHGSQTLTQAVQHSCNVAFVNIGLRVGAESFYKYAKAFGFFEKTGIELSGESTSLWWDDDYFTNPLNQSSLAAASFGQTFNITPLQLITAVSACVNGGYLMQPYLVEQVVDSDGEVMSTTEPVTVRQVLSEETSAQVREILEQVVGDANEGTGRNAYVSGYRIGGKTGTSTNTVKEGETGVKEYIVSFIGFAPANDPEIAILVLLDCPGSKDVYVSGGQMAAPTVGKMFADILPYMGVEATYSEEEMENLDKTVPGVKGMTVEEATAALKESGLGIRVIGSGSAVTSQLPFENAVVAADTEVVVYCDTEPSEEMVEVPDLYKLTYSEARQRAALYGLFIKSGVSGFTANSSDVVVVGQSVAAGTMVENGSVIEVTLVDQSDLGVY